MPSFLHHVRIGDLLLVALAAGGVAWSFAAFWGNGGGQTVLIRADGRLVDRVSLRLNRSVAVPGPLGQTTVEIRDGRVRIAADPSPRQYCVRQGWLDRPGQVALCLPNRTSVEIARDRSDYDSLGY